MSIKLDFENWETFREQLEKRKKELGSIINPIIRDNELPPKEILEVCQIGKFFSDVGASSGVLKKSLPPNPDFVFVSENGQIGVEHTRILSRDSEKYFRVQTVVDEAAKLFQHEYPGIHVLATIGFKNDELKYKTSERGNYIKQIAELVYEVIQSSSCTLPDYLERIYISPHNQVSFNYQQSKWESTYLTKDRLISEVRKKEKKLVRYKQAAQILSEYWLVLFIGSLNSVSYKLNKEVDYAMNSTFDKVYLVADFDSVIVEVQ